MRKAIIRQNRPIASDKANPRIAYEKICCLREGFLAYAIHRLPNTVPIPAPATQESLVRNLTIYSQISLRDPKKWSLNTDKLQ